ncbi:MAG TPA: hypothetical protein VFP61_16410 [Acidimicrobiales bacterium]|nr:hypothetical protein [Acidimicrobiales bacterium]
MRAGSAADPTAPADSTPAGDQPPARVAELSLDKPWVANLSTVLIAIGVLLVLLAVVRHL